MNPFDQLRDDGRPVAPDPRFVERLRTRLHAELAPPVKVPDRKEPSAMTDTPAATNRPTRQVLTPYISVHDGVEALDWYVASLGATEIVRYVGDDGRLGHAEFVINGAVIMLSDAYPEMGVVAANSYEGSSCALVLDVADCDAMHERAVAGGATSLASPTDQPHGARSATIMDPYGHRWMLSQPVRTLSHDEINDNYDDFQVIASPAPDTDPDTSDTSGRGAS